MKKNFLWFTLIEIIIAVGILSIGVFWVYKMLSLSLANTNETIKKTSQDLLISSFKECLKSIWYNSLSWSYNVWSGFSMNFWNSYTWCLTWSFDNNYTFSWVYMNNWTNTWINFYLFAKVLEKNITWMKFKINSYSQEYWYLYSTWKTSSDIWSWHILTITK